MSPLVRVLALALITVVLAAVGTQVRVTTDLTEALPQTGEDGELFADVRRFSLLDTVLVDVDGHGRSAAEVGAAVDALGAKIAALAEVRSVRYRWELADGIALQRAAAPFRVSLTPEAQLREATSPPGLRAGLERARARLASPFGAMEAARFADDPLGLSEAFAQRMSQATATGGATLTGGHLLSADGHALILVRPRDPAFGTDLESPLYVDLTRLMAESPLPATWSGAHRFAAEAQSLITREVNFALGLDLVFLAIVFGLAFRSPRPFLGASGAVVVGGAAALAMGALISPVHAISLAFGGALASLGVDYWIHLFVTGVHLGVPATWRGRFDVGVTAVNTLLPAYLISAGATVCAFLMLTLSNYPAVAGLGWLGLAGVVGALVSVLIGGPLLFATVARPVDHVPDLPVPGGVPRGLAWALVALVVALAAIGIRVGFDGDPRSLDLRRPESDAIQLDLEARWGGGTSGLLVARGDDLDAALTRLREASGLTADTNAALDGPQALLPDAATVAARAAVVADRQRIEADFTALATELGFAPEALMPGLRATLGAVGAPTVDTWTGTPAADLLARTVRVEADGTAAVAAFVDVPQEADMDALALRLQGAPARLVYPVGVVRHSAERIRSELAARTGFGIAVAGLFMALRYRDARKAFAAALPTLGAVGGTLGALTLLDVQLNPVSGPAFVLVLGLAFDQGIFLVEADAISREAFLAARAAILIALAAAFAGFAGLLAASHPAVHGVGLVVTLGIAFIALTAFLIVPAILTRRTP